MPPKHPTPEGAGLGGASEGGGFFRRNDTYFYVAGSGYVCSQLLAWLPFTTDDYSLITDKLVCG